MNYQDAAEKLIRIFEDAMDLCWDHSRLSDMIDDSVERTEIFRPQDMPLTETPEHPQPGIITVTQERTLAAAQRLHKADSSGKITVLNFASATNPGGGVKKGSSAQEESLCRCSTLYQCLDTNRLMEQFYGMHRKRKDLRYTDTCIYTPGIVVFNTDTRFPERMPEQEWFSVDVMTCAAPNLRKVPYNRMNKGYAEPITLTDAELLAIHKQRGEHLLNIAAAHGTDYLVLGAFGCGAFANKPEIVAQAYKEILPSYLGYFKEVCFAVYCPPKDPKNYQVFQQFLEND